MSKMKNPPAIMRPAPFWSWNDKLDEAELRRQIREMSEKGWGSYFMHSRVGLVTTYLSDEWMHLVNACADEAEKTGTLAWLYDEDKWPSGFAGGEVPRKDKAFRSRALVLVLKGQVESYDTVITSVNHKGIDFDICCRVSELDSKYFNGASYVDLMNPDAVREFIRCTHDRYKESCAEYFGKSIPGIFTDEPCYLMFGHYDVPVVPWSDFLPGFFRKMKGYNIQDHLPELFFDIDDYRKIRFDFYDAASELFKQSFTKPYYDWCNENNMIMTGHFMAEDSLFYQTMWSGDVMTHYEYMTWPGIDKLGRMLDQIVTVKQVTSAVDQLGKERSFSEVYGAMGGQCSFFDRKWIGDWQAALGISFVNHHLSLYSMRGERKRDYPANLFYQQPWWSDEREFADYQGRLCTFAAEGKRQVDILLLQPLASVWSEYSPVHADNFYAVERTFDDPFARISLRLTQEKLDYHYGNESLMAKFASVDDGMIKVGQHAYKCIVVPPASNIKSSTLKLLEEYGASGGNIIFTGGAPTMVDGITTAIKIPNSRIALSVDEAVGMASALFSDRVKVIDTITGVNAPSVIVHSRKLRSTTRHLFANTSNNREVKAKIEIPSCEDKPMAALDLYTGEMYKVEYGTIEVTLYPAGSLVFICGDEAASAQDNLPAIFGSGAAFNGITTMSPALLIDELKCNTLNENTLVLNDFTLEMNGAKVYDGPLCGSWHQFFYPAAEGTPFRAIYSFDSEDEIEGCFAAIEVAENLDKIYFNGVTLKPCKQPGELGSFDKNKSWLDINFTKVALPIVKVGINTLVLEGRKSNNITGPGFHAPVDNWQEHKPTEAEEVYICGSFSLKKLVEGKYIVSKFHEPAGYNLTNEGFPFYCGCISLTSTFKLGAKPQEKTLIRLNGVSAAAAEVIVNGISCGKLRWEPMIADISCAVRSGENKIEIRMATTLVNAFGPNRMAGIKESPYVSPDSFLQMGALKAGYELFDFGIESVGIYVE